MKALAILLVLALGAYGAVLVALFFGQTGMLFPVRLAAATGPIPSDARELAARAASGEKLRGLHVPARARGDPDRPVVLGFGGNAWNAAAAAVHLHDLFPEADVVTFHYRGYPPSEGLPGAEALQSDAPLVFDLVAGTFPDRPVVVVGFSIGTGVAARLARRRSPDGLILVTPFDSLAKVRATDIPGFRSASCSATPCMPPTISPARRSPSPSSPPNATS